MNALHPMKNPIVDGEIPVSIWYSKKLIHQIGTIFTGWWLTYTPLKNMTSSVGRMTFPIVMG
jgi:hypothetical protein